MDVNSEADQSEKRRSRKDYNPLQRDDFWNPEELPELSSR